MFLEHFMMLSKQNHDEHVPLAQQAAAFNIHLGKPNTPCNVLQIDTKIVDINYMTFTRHR